MLFGSSIDRAARSKVGAGAGSGDAGRRRAAVGAGAAGGVAARRRMRWCRLARCGPPGETAQDDGYAAGDHAGLRRSATTRACVDGARAVTPPGAIVLTRC